MALFRSDAAPDTPRPRTASNPAEQHTIVGAGTTFDGTLRARGNLNVSGTITGDVAVDGRTMVMPGGVVDGQVASTEAEIAGHIKGMLTVRERLVLRTTAVIDGDIRAGALVIEDGAVFNGRCEMGAGASEGLAVPGGLRGASTVPKETAAAPASAPAVPAVRSLGAPTA